jgi:hypothetical protein
MSSLSPEAYAVIEGRHSDPFRYLGPHVEGGVPLVRIFLPDAEGVAIVDEQGHLCRQLLQVNRRPGSRNSSGSDADLHRFRQQAAIRVEKDRQVALRQDRQR